MWTNKAAQSGLVPYVGRHTTSGGRLDYEYVLLEYAAGCARAAPVGHAAARARLPGGHRRHRRHRPDVHFQGVHRRAVALFAPSTTPRSTSATPSRPSSWPTARA